MDEKQTIRKKNLIFAIKAVLFIAVLSAVLFAAMKVTERKGSRIKNGSFFAAADKTDVLFLGSSHMINGIDPVQLFEETGIASFNLAGHGSILPVTYWTLVNALDYCDPLCVVVDVFMVEEDYHYVDEVTDRRPQDMADNSVGQLHEAFDVFPYSRNKKAAVQDLITDKEIRNEFYIDFIRYHSRWSSLTAEDYQSNEVLNARNRLMGAEMRFNTEPQDTHYSLIAPADMIEGETEGLQYLRRIIELCRDRGIMVLLINIPYEAADYYQRAANAVQPLADEMQVPFLNLMYAPGLIDTETDLSSPTHLNAHGAKPVTTYIGQALQSLAMPDRRGQAGYEIWEALSAGRRDNIVRNAVNAQDAYSALTMCAFDEISSIIFINEDSPALHDEHIRHLLSVVAGTGISEEIELQGFDTASSSGSAYLLVHDSAAGIFYEAYQEKILEDLAASFGTVRFNTIPGIYNVLQMKNDGGEYSEGENLLNYDEHASDDIQILLFDSATGEYKAHLYFNYDLRRY